MMFPDGFGKHSAWKDAATVALKLASPLFKVSMALPVDGRKGNEYFEAWWSFRQAAAGFLNNSHTRMREADRAALGVACRVAHDLAHDNLPGDVAPVESCGCEVAELRRELAELIHAGECGEGEAAA